MTLPNITQNDEVLLIIQQALKEDLGGAIKPEGDATSFSLIHEGVTASAEIISRDSYIVSGTQVAEQVFLAVDASLECKVLVDDGSKVSEGATIMSVDGPARGILTAERTALNFMQRMTGIASKANVFVKKVEQYDVEILDTRKTTPSMRVLEKYAVLCGGGSNHRMGLYDRVMIKDNHRSLYSDAGSLSQAVQQARRSFPGIDVEVEVENIEEFKDVLSARPEWILIDNTPADELKKYVELCKGQCKLEASGGIDMSNVEPIAATGVDAISLGCLTHSVVAADLSLEIKK